MKLGGEKIPDGYRFHIEDNPNTLSCILESNGNPAIAYTPGGELRNIIHCRSVDDMEDKPNAWLKTARNAKVTRINCSTKTIENRWDGPNVLAYVKDGVTLKANQKVEITVAYTSGNHRLNFGGEIGRASCRERV